MEQLQIKKVHPNAILPTRGTADSAGLDFSACMEEPITLQPGEIKVIPTGIAIALQKNTVGLMFGRSGLGVKYGITLANAVGVIDADYRGEVRVGLQNHSQKAYVIEPGDRISQLVVTPILLPEVVEVEELSETERNQNGFGSTGR